ncbi:hypothetical protein DCS_05989 [Drechmeria coniospora]|uniref:Uncharacterized protein n=1 Tax=Drechmeria coniospora TaxID=98403 RepID=A0A151GAD2_DRECN|nr:hypothetical protein DCS_05989 [Drechmeria coniospora]KYK54035.1 hypothetical protein DCS_05989 [Drechmeria coniospora]
MSALAAFHHASSSLRRPRLLARPPRLLARHPCSPSLLVRVFFREPQAQHWHWHHARTRCHPPLHGDGPHPRISTGPVCALALHPIASRRPRRAPAEGRVGLPSRPIDCLILSLIWPPTTPHHASPPPSLADPPSPSVEHATGQERRPRSTCCESTVTVRSLAATARCYGAEPGNQRPALASPPAGRTLCVLRRPPSSSKPILPSTCCLPLGAPAGPSVPSSSRASSRARRPLPSPGLGPSLASPHRAPLASAVQPVRPLTVEWPPLLRPDVVVLPCPARPGTDPIRSRIDASVPLRPPPGRFEASNPRGQSLPFIPSHLLSLVPVSPRGEPIRFGRASTTPSFDLGLLRFRLEPPDSSVVPPSHHEPIVAASTSKHPDTY